MRFRRLHALLLVAVLAGCQMAPVRIEFREIKSLKGLEEYMGLAAESRDFSLEVLKMLLDDYFAEASEVFKERLNDYEKFRGLYEDGKLDEEPAFPTMDHEKVIKGLRAIVERYPHKRGMGVVLYTLGYALQEDGRLEEAGEVFEEVAASREANPYGEEVSFRLGEIYLDTGRTGESIDAYMRITSHPGSLFYEKALYKLGWAYYRRDDFTEAIVFFAGIADKYEKLDPGGSADLSLRDEALDSIVMCLGHMKKPGEIEGEILKLRHKGYAPRLAVSTGKLLTAQTRYKEAISVYSLFQDIFPEDPTLPLVFMEMAGAYERLNKAAEALAAKEALVESYNPTTALYRINYPDGDPEVDSIVAGALLDVAGVYHERAGKTGSPRSLEAAVDAYNRYLSYYPDIKSSREVRLKLAEAFFDAKEYARASEMYEALMLLYKDTAAGEDAAFAAVLSHELLISGGDPEQAEETTGALTRITAAFKAEFPESKRTEELVHKAADLYMQMGRYDEARAVLSPLLRGSSARAALKKTGDIYTLEKDLPSAIGAYTSAMKISPDEELRNDLSQLHYMVAVEHIQREEPDKAVENYLKVFNLLKDSGIAEKALISVGRIYLDRGDVKEFRTVMDLLKKNYPDSEGTLALLVAAGKGFEEKGEAVTSAAMFEEAARAVGTGGGARTEWEGDEAERLVFKAASVLKEAGEHTELERLLQEQLRGAHISPGRRPEAMYMLAEVRLASGKTGEGRQALTALIKEAGTAGATPYAARARAMVADMKLEEFLALSITQPFKQSLRKKETLLKEILGDYKVVLKSKNAELLPGAFYKMGLAFMNFRDSLLGSERPPGLSDEELEEYAFLLEERAYPLEEEAVRAFEGSLKASVRHGVKWEVTRDSLKRLAELRPALYRRELDVKNPLPIFHGPEPARLR
ncbi:MAG: tetratricopeptide repeat protein [Thermodesulfobacteriota bacterium]